VKKESYFGYLVNLTAGPFRLAPQWMTFHLYKSSVPTDARAHKSQLPSAERFARVVLGCGPEIGMAAAHRSPMQPKLPSSKGRQKSPKFGAIPGPCCVQRPDM
jgi:hypothetical protein